MRIVLNIHQSNSLCVEMVCNVITGLSMHGAILFYFYEFICKIDYY